MKGGERSSKYRYTKLYLGYFCRLWPRSPADCQSVMQSAHVLVGWLPLAGKLQVSSFARTSNLLTYGFNFTG